MTNVPSLGTPGHIALDEHDIDAETKNSIDKGQGLIALNEASKSKFVLDSTINTHPRFASLVKSIRERRGEKVEIRVPLYKDERTNMTEPTEDEPFPGEIYMDAMHFGMG